MSPKKVRIGIVGCGNISPSYFNAAKKFNILEIAGCTDLIAERSAEKAKEYGTVAYTPSELFARKDIDLIINLTPPNEHAKVSLAALKAGKHVHSEKPLATNLADGQAILALAKEKGLLVGCAPDTFLGAGLQTARKVIDDGWIGKVFGGTAFFLGSGMESWHPNPDFFFQPGGGPMLDLGPYYVTALINTLGPVAQVSGFVTKGRETRLITSQEHYGETIQVNVPTHQAGVLKFHSGAIVNVAISFDVQAHQHKPLELYGTLGSLELPDPNNFGGPVRLATNAGKREWNDVGLSHNYADNMRSIGAADLAHAIVGNRPHRASGELAYHALEVMLAFETSSKTGRAVRIHSKPKRPAALPLGLVEGWLD
ncbi:MAG: Gfo/Idh/MocA family oxidoreductase [Spirochaetales bacterium]